MKNAITMSQSRESLYERNGEIAMGNIYGKVLRIDLSRQKICTESLNPSWAKPVIGGRAANTKRLLEELPVNCDPLGIDNMLIFGVGPLTGSLLPASSYYTVSAKSPLTGILGDSAAGGQFAAEMKLTGYDQIIMTGKSDDLVYVLVKESGADIINCPEYEGKTIIEITHCIRKDEKDYSIQVAAIGPAGENCVLYASIVSSGNRVNARTGMGAVMGSKNVKAVAVKGSHPVDVHDPILFLDEVKKIEHAIKTHPEYEKRYLMGTTMLMKDLNSIGILPTNHFQKGVCTYVDQISGQHLAETYKVKNKACFNCNLHCSRYYICKDIEAEGPEFETLCSLTSRIGNDDLEFALQMNEYVNQMGLDSISLCEVIGWLMECQEKGLVNPEEIGFHIAWGDNNTVYDIVRKIVYRHDIGDLLAQGARKVAERYGREAQNLVMHVKGLDIICGDPRGIKAYGLTYAVASRGADHLRAEPYFELTNRREEASRRFGTEKAADRLSEEGKAALVAYSEKIALLCDCITMCKNIGLCMDVLTFENVSSLLTAGTGVPYTPEYLEKSMGSCIDRDHDFNKKLGMTRDDDTLPERFVKEPLTDGPTKGSVVNIQKMVSEYYTIHGWE
ncbi:MAG: aldehyde ferredoxin oxidoreductase family protein [Theionarchaea archaeon]|nr:aldehyde ferredoxin oxidoreductase family protein [Theionarchaea archaeon]